MATPKIISINQLIKMFSDFADSHLQLNDFGYGPTSDIGTSKQMDFPYLWTTHRTASEINVTNKTQIPKMSLTFLVVDQINIQKNIEDTNGLNSDNSQEIISDTFQIIQDLIGYISTSLGKYGVQLMDEAITVEPLFDETEDKVSGWIIDINLQLKYVNCAYPTDGLAPIVPNICPSTVVKNSDGSYTVTVPSGDELILPDITHTDSDGSPEVLPAQTSMVCTPAADATVQNSDLSYSGTVASGGILTLPDIDIEINGTYLTTSASTVDVSLVVKNTDGDTTGSPIGGEWIVPKGTSTSTISYSRENWRQRPVNYFNHDLAWYRSNTTLFDYQDGGDRVVLDKANEDLLLTRNAFGSFLRVTNDSGGTVYDGSDGSTPDYLVDHYTGLGWYLLEAVSASVSWVDSALAVQSFTAEGFSDWRMPTAYDVRQILYTDGTTNITTVNEIYAKNIFWVMDSLNGTTATIWRSLNEYSSATVLGGFSTTSPNVSVSTIVCRNHYNANPNSTPVRTAINGAPVMKTGVDTSYVVGDDASEDFGRANDFYTLDHLNGFGTTDRFTDDLGTQVYASDVVIDWSTFNQIKNEVLAYYRVAELPAILTTILAAQPYTKNSLSGWYLTNAKEMVNIFNFSEYRDPLNYAPFNYSVASTPERLWTSTMESAGVAYIVANTSALIVNNTVSTFQSILRRTYTLGELGLSPVISPVIGYVRPANRAIISYGLYDEGWQKLNGVDPYVPPTNAVMARLDTNSPEDLLLTVNAFGNYRRYTGYAGGYYQHSDSTYRDVDGNLSTEAAEFIEAGFGKYIIDHYTGLGWRKERGGSHNWLNGMAYVYTITLDGHSDWFPPSSSVLNSIIDRTYNPPLSKLPFDIQLSQGSSTPTPNLPTTNYFQHTSSGLYMVAQNQGTSSAYSFVRVHYN